VTWTWDMSRIEAKGCADNVVDLMVAKLGRLPTPAQHLLKLLACLGTRASMAGLALVSGVAPEDQPAALQGAVAGGLVLSQAAAFAFAHDRVREAAYALLSGPQRAQDHLHIGRLMLARTEADVLTGFVFEIVDQLNRGAELMTQPEERTRTAELNRLAARRARISTAYASALKYLAAGIGLLDEDAWQQHHALAFDLHLMRSECEFLAGHIEIAEPLLLNLLPHAATPTERAAAYRLLVALHVVRSDYANAVARALECLALLGIDLVAHPSAQQLADAYIDVQRQLEQRSIEAWIDLPPATDPEVEAAMSVLSELFAPACFTDERLAVIHLCRMVGLTLRHGLTPASAQGFAWFGIMLGRYYGRHADGHRFAELSRALVQRHGFAAYEAKSLFSLEIASGWVRPLETVIALSRAAFTAGAERGDVAIACFACHHTVNDALVRGGNLDDIAHDIESGLAFVRQAGFHDVADELVTQQRFVQALRGQTASLETWDGADFDTARFEARFTDGRMPTMIFWHWLIKAQALFIAGQPEQASRALKRAGELTWSAVHVQYLNYPFFSALTLAALAGSDLLAHDKLERLEHIGLHRQQLAAWRDGCPANFADKVALVDAEMARLESRFLDAGRLYQQAADLAREHGFTQNEAIANELAARFYAEQGLRMASHACLRDARYAYSRWGAVAKVRQIDAAFALAPPGASRPEFVTTAIDTSVERLDLATIVRVSQALSGEIQLDRLIDTLLSVVIEHAGAQRGLLILSRGDDWRIEAEGATGDERVSVTVRQSGVTAEVTSKNVPQTVLHYVARTRKSVLLDDASSPNPFVSDAYFLDKRVQEQPPRSVLCLPLLKQTRLVGVLYLENNLAPRVFTPQRLALLELLASQAAISLENARLYADLECENRERRAAETEGSRAQAALQESESRFRRMADATPDVLWITELNPHRVVYASPSFERIWGLAVEDLYREPALWISGIHPDDRGRVDTGFARWTAGSAGAQWDVEFRVVRPDGTLRWIHERGFIISEEHKPQRVSGISTDITERRVAEVALRESQERFALAVAGSNDGIWDWDMLTHQTFMSERGQRLYGLQPGVEVRPHPEWRAMIEYHPDDVLPQREMVEAYLSLRAPAYDGEWRVRHADGAYRWVRIRGLCVRDSAGRATRLTGSITDIDEQKQTEHALRQSEKRHSLAMEASRDGHWDWIIERDEYYVSPRMLEIYGFPQDARFAGRSDFVRQLTFHPEDRARWEKGIAEHFAGTTPRFAIEIRMLRHGVTRWLHFVGLLLRDSSGKPLRWAGSMSDVTDRVAGELALRESEDRFSLAVAASNDGIWEVNLLSDQMFMSERAQQLHGLGAGPTVLPRAEWLAKITFHPADLQTLRDMYIGYLAGQVPSYDGEWRVRHADGSYRWVRIRGLCVRDAQGRALRVAGSVSDIDAQKRAEAALQQAQRLEAVGTLAGGIAHDFNNILGAILGFGEMALRRTRAGSLMRRDIELMLTAGERGRSLVERILAFSRTGVSERVPVHVEGVVREVLNLLRASLPEDVRIESDLRAANAATLGDSTQVHQVLMNLATNAIQAMPEGGVLRVTLTEKRLTDAIVVATGAVAAGEYLVLSVTDTGAGISQEIGHRIFDPFFTTKEVGSGTGLGLSLVHGIISELGGAVDVTSTAGAGSSFTAYLPRVDDVGDVAGPAEDEPVVVARGAHEQILLVDDEEPLVRLMTDTLSDIGYVVVGFTSSLDALAAFTAHPDRFDAVVTDERMPGLSGTALIRAVREIRPSIPVLLASGYVGADVAERARAAGADAVLSKPLAAAELAGALARVLRSRAPVWAQVII
jgi:PAS domain S-box-containing protein